MYTVSLVTDVPFIDTVQLGSVASIQDLLCVVKFTSITHLETAGLRLSQSMQLLGATPFGKAPEKSGFISEFTSSIFLRKFCRGPG